MGGGGAEPADEPALLLEDQRPPGQWAHGAADPAVAGAGQSLLAPALAALVRRAGQSGIARNSSAIAQIARQHLIHQHVGSFDADAQNLCDQTNHRVGTCRCGGGFSKPAQTVAFDWADMAVGQAHPPPNPPPLPACLLRPRRPFPPRRLAQLSPPPPPPPPY